MNFERLEGRLEVGSSGDSFALQYAVAYAFMSYDAELAYPWVFPRFRCNVSPDQQYASRVLGRCVNYAVCAFAALHRIHRQGLSHFTTGKSNARARHVLAINEFRSREKLAHLLRVHEHRDRIKVLAFNRIPHLNELRPCEHCSSTRNYSATRTISGSNRLIQRNDLSRLLLSNTTTKLLKFPIHDVPTGILSKLSRPLNPILHDDVRLDVNTLVAFA